MAKNVKEEFGKVIAKINEKNPYYLIAGFLVLLLIVDYLVVMQFQLRTLSTLSPKIKGLSDELSVTENNIQRLPQYKKEIERLSSSLERINKKVRTKEEIPMILENISVIANRNGVKIEQIMPDTTTTDPILQNDSGAYYSIPIVVEAKSGYHELGRFLSDLEREGALLSIPDFTIGHNKSEPRANIVKMTLNVIVLEKKR